MTSFTPLKLVAITASAVLFTACASTPKTTDIVTAPVTSGNSGNSGGVFNDAPAEVVPPVPVTPIPQQITAPPVPQFSGAVPGSLEDFVASAGDRIFFGYNQFSLNNEARNVLRSQAQWMNNYPAITAVIGGHCDERGTREYNLALGARRADAVKDFLVSQGVDPSRLQTVSFGKERPIDGSSNEQAWSLNRNAHTALVTPRNS